MSNREDDIDEKDYFATQEVKDCAALVKAVDQRLKDLDKIGQLLAKAEAHMECNKVILDIAGTRFPTSKVTLLKYPGSFFEDIFNGRWKPEADGTFFIDRDPELFPIILEYLRTGKITIKQAYDHDITEGLKTEAEFYRLRIPDEIIWAMESKILKTPQMNQLKEWTGRSKFTLLYRASRDGFAGSTFHSKCDNKGPTVSVIKSTNGYLFGGYAEDSWESSNDYKSYTSCFLFTLTNPNNIKPTKYPYTQTSYRYAMYCYGTYGPTFGNGHDLYVCNNSNTDRSSYANFPYCYSDTTGYGKNTFTGAYNFTTSEIEVFQVTN